MRIHLSVHNTPPAIYDTIEAEEQVIDPKTKYKRVKDEHGNEIVFHNAKGYNFATRPDEPRIGHIFVFEAGNKEALKIEDNNAVMTIFGKDL